MKLIMNPDGKTGTIEIQGYAADFTLVKSELEQRTDQIGVTTFGDAVVRYAEGFTETIATLTFVASGPLRRVERQPDDPFPKRIIETV